MTLAPQPYVSIIRAGDDPRPVMAPGQTLTVSVGVGNMRGDADAHYTVLTMVLPTGLRLEQARPGPDRTLPAKGGQSLVWNLGTLKAGAFPRIFEADLTAEPDVPAGTELPVSATLARSGADPNQKNNNAILSLHVQPPAADVAVQSELNAVPLIFGHPATFAAEVSNLGVIVAAGTTLTLVLPENVELKSSDPVATGTSGGTVSWQIGDLVPGATRAIAIVVTLGAKLATGASEATPENLLKFKFDASTTSTQTNSADSHLEIAKHVELAGSDLKVWLSIQGAENPGELPVGKDVIYTITYGNFGNTPAKQTSVSLSLSEGLSLLGAEPSPEGMSKNEKFPGGVLSWNVGDLAVGQSRVIQSHIHVASIPEDGSLVMAAIAAPGSSVNSGESVAYSLRHAARGTALRGAAAQSGHLLRWILLVTVLLVILWVAFRAWRRRIST